MIFILFPLLRVGNCVCLNNCLIHDRRNETLKLVVCIIGDKLIYLFFLFIDFA